MRTQRAFDHLGAMLAARYRDWYLALADLPTWDEQIDAEVQQYIRAVQNVAMANLNWRYLSLTPSTWIHSVMVHPLYMLIAC